MDFKDIHIGTVIKQLVTECGVETPRLCNFLYCTEEEIEAMYESKSLDTEVLLRWSKLLEYDFFRLYSQHLILYAPVAAQIKPATNHKKTSLPQFRKNIYTKEIIDFILEQINSREMTKIQVMERYRIPKTTLYKWMEKYKK